MLNGKWFVLSIGVMILLAFGSAACSAEAPEVADPASPDNAKRAITVYESPT